VPTLVGCPIVIIFRESRQAHLSLVVPTFVGLS
jgi:hypothetical protein